MVWCCFIREIFNTILIMEKTCLVCGCTDSNCSQCIERTGKPCYWINPNIDVCSACIDIFCIKLLIKYFEYIIPIAGLCNLTSTLFYDKRILDQHESAELRIWLHQNYPYYKARLNNNPLYSWRIGDIDARWYWLQNKLKEIERSRNASN
jgi:hypothetical protein